jgi:hypothetical protein
VYGAAPGVHEEVSRQLGVLPRGKLLDAPAGHGALSASALADAALYSEIIILTAE